MQPRGCGPHIPCLSGSHQAIPLTVNSSFKFDAQMSSSLTDAAQRYILPILLWGYFSLCFCGWLALLFYFIFFIALHSLGDLSSPTGTGHAPSCSPNTGPPGKTLAFCDNDRFHCGYLFEHYGLFSCIYLPRPGSPCSLLKV